MHTIFSNGKFHFGILLIILLFSFQQFSFSQFANSPLSPLTKTKFEDNLPVIKDLGLRIDLTKGGNMGVQMVETTQYLGINLLGSPYSTKVWAYQFPGLPPTYPGATIVAKKNKKVFVEWRNDNLPGHFLPVDASLHMAHPNTIHTIDEVRDWYAAGNVPTVAHLHGGHTESASDGLPEAWFTQSGVRGDYWVKQEYQYDNKQQSATLWYHDHALGITRLNVYAGLAGFYLLRDDNEERLIEQNVLPGGDYEIEIVIQDKMFDETGELFWPAYNDEEPYDEFIETLLPETDFPVKGGPTALAEFFGDYILVNGMTWPKLEVEPRKYRFRLLNGSDSRFYVLEFRNDETSGAAQPFMQIGTDNGLLARPVPLTQLLIAPGERMDLVVDFTGLEGSQIYLRNFGPDEPYGGGIPGVDFDFADISTTGQIMRFDVYKPFNEAIKNAKVKVQSRLRQNIMPLVQEGATRNLVLFEGSDEYGRLMPMLGTLADGSLTWSDAITENPMKNDTEVWEVYNATGDAHPIHLHLVSFQIINRESFVGTVADKTHTAHNGEDINGGLLTVTSLGGDARDPEDNEKGWKDTAVMLPREVTRVIARFDLEGRYVWHCHILSHEDHEMMRPFYVGTMPLPKQSGDVIAGVTDFSLDQNYPNPFNPSTTINFTVPQNTQVTLKIFDVLGKEVSTLI
ncbi:MAG: multicopper oxidase domain-containing protein, partial [Ignavibacteriaceae bacterium]